MLVPGSDGSVTSDQFRLRLGWFRQELIKSDKPFTFPKIETTTWPYARDIAVERDDYDYGVLFHVQYLKGDMYVLNMPDNSYDLLRFPAQALNVMRRAFVKDLGVELDGPGGVGMYLFGDNQYVLYNMSDDVAPMSLRFTGKVAQEGWKELVHGASLEAKQDARSARFGGPVITDVSITLKPFEIAVIQEP
jgi:hypothetical protein